MPQGVIDAGENEVFEVGFANGEVMSRLARIASTQGGAILVIDYGYNRTQTGETLQAVQGHQYADVLAEPGAADLSAHVDFEALGIVAAKAGLAVQPLATQGEWLVRMGINERTKALSGANPQQADSIRSARDRLVEPRQMGELFKVFCAASPGLVPPGFS
jgi:SAM-dependent MidA family methyltransferase